MNRADYRPVDGHFDEMMDPDGQVRPHWVPLMNGLAAHSKTDLDRKIADSRRAIQRNGMTYHVHKDSTPDQARPWPLDIVPFVMAAEEWQRIEAAVIQRASLLNSVLADVYGRRRCIEGGILPPELVFNHPGFSRECHGIEPPGGTWLNVYAVDLARSHDGTWWIISDRTEAPGGAGYALENRIVVRQAFGEAFESSSARRLAPYFGGYKESLFDLAGHRKEAPRIVVLSAGPSAESYFEHAYLARYLGYTLAEGSDLTVRDRQVYMRTLGGLLPVDLIVRRQASADCDPLELGLDSAQGAAGLLDAARAGNVAIANALGSGFAESPALMAFLPALCRMLRREELLLPSIATWWCGQDDAREYVLGDLDRFVIKDAFPQATRNPRFPALLGEDKRQALQDEIEANPASFAAQEHMALSTAPVHTERGLEPRFVVLRAYAVASGDSYRVMPGGLARVSPDTASPDVTVLSGGQSKDVWVLGGQDEAQVSLLPIVRKPVDVSRATFDLPSRVAENLYWLGRYAERIEAMARLVRATLPLLSAETTRYSAAALSSARELLRDLGYAAGAVSGDGQAELVDALERLVRYVVVAADGKGSFAWQIRQLRNTAWLLRDRLSGDAWRIVSRLESDYRDAHSEARAGRGLEEMLDSAVANLAGFGGAAMEGMTRGHGWRLLDIGRRLERALQVLVMLRHGLVQAPGDERSRIELLLEAADSSITYRSRYLTSLQADLVIDLLLIDDANPRAVAFQLDRLAEHVRELPAGHAAVRISPEVRLVTDAVAAVQLARLEELAAVRSGRRAGLAETLARVQKDLEQLSETLTRDYLTHAKPFRHMANQ